MPQPNRDTVKQIRADRLEHCLLVVFYVESESHFNLILCTAISFYNDILSTRSISSKITYCYQQVAWAAFQQSLLG